MIHTIGDELLPCKGPPRANEQATFPNRVFPSIGKRSIEQNGESSHHFQALIGPRSEYFAYLMSLHQRGVPTKVRTPVGQCLRWSGEAKHSLAHLSAWKSEGSRSFRQFCQPSLSGSTKRLQCVLLREYIHTQHWPEVQYFERKVISRSPRQ